MAVLIEGISVIARRDAIERVYPDGWRGFVRDAPNATLCSDGELARVGFLDPDSTRRFIDSLVGHGLKFHDGEQCLDIAVVDQQRGPTLPCSWLEFGRLPLGEEGGRISLCWLFEGERIAAGLHFRATKMELATPPGWEYAGSLSEHFEFRPLDGSE